MLRLNGPSRSNPQRRQFRYALASALLLLILLVPSSIIEVGQWLVVQDPLQPSRAIVVLSGQMPFRAMEAARLYHDGLAPEVWLTRGVSPAEEAALRRLGIEYPREETYSIQVLKRLGVPDASIRLLVEPIFNTQDEALLVSREARRVGSERVILVTSKSSSRRTRAIWNALIGRNPLAIVRYASEDPYDPRSWWRNTSDIQAVSHEILGLLNVWTGFRIRPNQGR